MWGNAKGMSLENFRDVLLCDMQLEGDLQDAAGDEAEDQLWEEMRLAEHERVSRLIEPELQRPKAAEAAKARQPKHSASTCEEQSEVPEMLPWEGLRVEEASATLPASTPSSPSRPSCPKWHGQVQHGCKEKTGRLLAKLQQMWWSRRNSCFSRPWKSLVLLHNEMDQLQNNKTKRDPHLEEIGQKVRELELDSSLTEVVKAQSTAEVMPEVILHELCRFLEVGKALSLKTLIGLLETEWAFQFRRQGQDQNDLVLPIKPFMKALRACYPSSGRAVLLSLIGSNAGSAGSRYLQVELSSAESIRKYAGRKPDAVPSSIGLLQSLLGLNRQVHLNASLQKLIRSALCQNVDIPQNLKEILRKYQADGFRWLACNAENCIGSLLADDMGLGKTLQCAALLQYLCHEGKISVEKPALVVVPFSVLGNWKTELRRWTPSLRPKVYHGKARSLQGDAEVVITTYSILLLDQAKFISSGLQLACMVLDESQYIKNSQSLTAQETGRVDGQFMF
eukprot:g16006.t1